MTVYTNGTPPPYLADDPAEWGVEALRMFVCLIASRIGADGTSKNAILGRINNIIRPGTVRIRPMEMCPECSLCRDNLPPGTGCYTDWDDMSVLEVEDDGQPFGDEDECRVCDCGVGWIAVRCDSCRREYNAMVHADEDCHAAREES